MTSCVKTEVLNVPLTKSIDTSVVKKHRPHPPRPPQDTARIPIGFDAVVKEWEVTEIEL